MRWRRALTASLVAVAGTTLAAMGIMTGPAKAGMPSTAPLAAAVSAASASAAPAGHWGDGRQIPLTGLDVANVLGFGPLSCASPSNCTGSGTYSDSHRATQVFVVSEVSGTWQKAASIPGLGTLNAGGSAAVNAVSCPAPGTCAVGGFYTNGSDVERPFVANSTNGAWGSARDISDVTSTSTSADFEVTSLSCAAAGDCGAGLSVPQSVANGSGTEIAQEAYVATESGGAWATAKPVPGVSDRNTGLDAEVTSVSCGARGDCAAGGFYTGSGQGNPQFPFLAAEHGGSWGTTAFPALPPTDPTEPAQVVAVSCRAAGKCLAGGSYADPADHEQAFTVTEAGTWGDVQPLPGASALAGDGGASQLTALACGAPGDCAVTGFDWVPGDGAVRSFVVAQANGAWGSPQQVTGGDASAPPATSAATCASAGNCLVTGEYSVPGVNVQVFVVAESGGTWGTFHPVAGNLAAGTFAVLPGTASCPRPGNCTLSGTVEGHDFVTHAFAVEESTASSTTLKLSASKVTFGKEQAAQLTVTVSGRTGGTPAGTVTVKAGTSGVCTIKLASGKGSCTLAAIKLRPGSYHVTASYGGDATYAGSASGSAALTVASEPTTTSLTLSAVKVKFGHEQSAKLTVAVKPQTSGTPAGKVTIKAGPATLCVITLKSAKGSCTLTASKLRPGSYQLTASYAGATPFAASTSARKTLTVTK